MFYSHLDPDHTLGIRILGQLRLDWGFSYDDYIKKNKKYSNIEFDYGGMTIEI